ncbi:hypothetical protein BpHYR1_007597 [Brachionus plicatilis]|uniref:Uncharacterized protein n=1 Tax=Brachionus plicatilis TaxID=10195 RepID=A0A3M7R180_BRAPC|nr:hypothetical protein BpHYR1_007597 [Brachionus plicatilis]
MQLKVHWPGDQQTICSEPNCLLDTTILNITNRITVEKELQISRRSRKIRKEKRKKIYFDCLQLIIKKLSLPNVPNNPKWMQSELDRAVSYLFPQHLAILMNKCKFDSKI